MKYREETGTVAELRGGKAVIEIDPRSAAACGMKCSCCSLSGSGKRILTTEAGDLKVGDRVKAEVPVHSAYLSMGLIFVLPVVLFFVGIWLGGMAGREDGGSGTISVLGGIGGLAVAFLIAGLVERKLSARGRLKVERLASGD